MNRFFLRFPGFRKKALALSYDDGLRSDLRLLGLLDRSGLRATFHLNAGLIGESSGPRPRLSAGELRAAFSDGPHEIAAHGFAHPFLEQLPAGGAAAELIRDRLALEALFGRLVRGLSYPMGAWSEEVLAAVRACGFSYARTTVSSRGFALPQNPLLLAPTCRHADPALSALCREFLELDVRWEPRLFLLWGHSYEFDEQGNWALAERFCREMGGRDEIWYASCGEAIDYLAAGRALRASADGALLENPTALPLCLETEQGNRLLSPGETVRLA